MPLVFFLLFSVFCCGALAASSTGTLCEGQLRDLVEPARTFMEWTDRIGRFGDRPVRSTRKDLPVLVIGAGPAGLANMIRLHERGVAFRGIERAEYVGGLWNR